MAKNASPNIRVAEEKAPFPVTLALLLGIMFLGLAAMGLKLMEII